MALIKQSTSFTRMFKMIDSSDHLSKKTGLTCTVNLSKAGAAFGAAGGAVAEVANGWYKVSLNTTDTNTLGDLAYYITATGADDTDFCDQVTANILGDTLPANVTQWNSSNVVAPNVAGIPLIDIKYVLGTIVTAATAGILDVNTKNYNNVAAATDGNNLPKVDVEDWKAGVVPAVNVTGVPLVDLKYTLGTISPAAAGSVAIDWAQVSNKTSTVALTNTTVATVTTVTNQLTAAAVATGVWTDTTAGDFTTAASVGKSVMNGVALGTGLTINAYTGNTVQTGDSYARIGAPVGATISADIAEIEGETDTLITGVNVTQWAGQNTAVDANNLPKVDVEAVNASTLAAQALAQMDPSVCWGTCSGGTTTTAVVGTLVNPSSLGATGQLIGRTIIFLGNTGTANLQAQASNITNSTTGATPTITFTAMTTAPANADKFVIV